MARYIGSFSVIILMVFTSFSAIQGIGSLETQDENWTLSYDPLDPFDWNGWDQDMDSNGIDDLLETDLQELQGDGDLIGLNIHFKESPQVSQVQDLLSGIRGAELHWISSISTSAYISLYRSSVPFLLSKTGNDIMMIEYRAPKVNFLDVSSPSTRSLGSGRYSPMTAEDLGYSGEGIVIAVIDSGVDNNLHESLRGKYIYGVDFTDTPVIEGLDPEDIDGHGTHVAGTALGTGGSSGTYSGTAPGAGLVDLRYARIQGDFTGNADRALEWIIDNHEEHGIRVTSCSWGSTSPTSGRDTTSRLVNELVDEGVVVVVAAGNDGSQGLPSPASADGALTVGALNDRDTIDRGDDSHDWYSNRGPRSSDGDLDNTDELKPDVIAPGTNIRSARHNTVIDYVDMTGTSMATPHVSGIAALMLQANPDLTPLDVKKIIRDTAQQKRSASLPDMDSKYNYRSGWGAVDAFGAVKRAEDLNSYSVEAPASVRLNQPFKVNVTGHLTKTDYDSQDELLELGIYTPLHWGPPSDYTLDPGMTGAEVTLGSPAIENGRWSVEGSVVYTSEFEDIEPILQVEVRPIGSIGDEETIEGKVAVNGIVGSVSETNVTITYDSIPPDLSVITTAIWFSDNLPEGGDQVDIHVRVNNTGGTDALGVLVHFLDGPPRTGRKIGEDYIDVDAFSSSISSTDWEANPGLHAITVIVDPENDIAESNEDNNTAERPLTVLGVNPPPIAQLDVDPQSGTTLTRFTFDGSGSTDTNLRGGNVVRYNFDFGDGDSTGWIESSRVEHVYRRGGSYTATLIVEDNGGTESQNDAEVQINITEVQSDEMVLFLNSSEGLSFDPGEPGTARIPVLQSTSTIGSWETVPFPSTMMLHTTIQIHAKVHSGEEQLIVLEAMVSTDSGEFTDEWELEHLGGGNESFMMDLLIQETEVQFREDLRLTLSGRSSTEDASLLLGRDGSKVTLYTYPVENELPSVDAGPDLDIKAGNEVTFMGTARDEDSGIYLSRWDVDGDSVWDAEGDVLEYNYDGYPQEGSYTARLEVTDNDGARSSDTVRVTVRPSDYNYAPIVSMICPASSVEGVIQITGTSDDDIGVTMVEVRIEGPSGPQNSTVLPWTEAEGSSSWSLVYDTRGLEDGNYLVSARAFDGERYSKIESCWAYIENPNNRPVIERVLITPVPLMLDGEEELLIRIDVDDPDLPNDQLFVTANLETIGGPIEAVLNDDGIGSDSDEDDGTYTISFLPSRSLQPGMYMINLMVMDRKGLFTTETAEVELYSTLEVDVDLPDGPFVIGREYLFKVSVSDDEIIDEVLLLIGNSSYRLMDDGRNGDRVAGDDIYSRRIEFEDPDDAIPYDIIVISNDGRELYSTSGELRIEDIETGVSGSGDIPAFILIIGSILLILALFLLSLLYMGMEGRRRKAQEEQTNQYVPPVQTVSEVVIAQVFEE